MSERANFSAHTDTQQQVAATRQLLRSGGLHVRPHKSTFDGSRTPSNTKTPKLSEELKPAAYKTSDRSDNCVRIKASEEKEIEDA